MKKPFRIKDCCHGEFVTNHEPVCDVEAQSSDLILVVPEVLHSGNENGSDPNPHDQPNTM